MMQIADAIEKVEFVTLGHLALGAQDHELDGLACHRQ
jgi:hypothetical protein